MVATTALGKPLREVGGFFGMSLDTLIALFTQRFFWREFIEQSWFTARVSMAPAIMLTIPFSVLIVFILNVVFFEIGAQDLSGSGAALAVATQLGPFTTILVVGGAAATAMCADLGARTIREEIDAMRVLGINPIQRMVVPRVAALTVNTLLLVGLVCVVALAFTYLFSVFVANVTPGAFMTSLTFLVGLADIVVTFVKAALFGIIAGLIACYKGLTVGGGPQGVGNAVNETVVYTFVVLVLVNTVVSGVTAAVTVR